MPEEIKGFKEKAKSLATKMRDAGYSDDEIKDGLRKLKKKFSSETSGITSSSEPLEQQSKPSKSPTTGTRKVQELPDGTVMIGDKAYSTDALLEEKFSKPLYARRPNEYSASSIDVYIPSKSEIQSAREKVNQTRKEIVESNLDRVHTPESDIEYISKLTELDNKEVEINDIEADAKSKKSDAVYGSMFDYTIDGSPVTRSEAFSAIMDRDFFENGRELAIKNLSEDNANDSELEEFLSKQKENFDKGLWREYTDKFGATALDVVGQVQAIAPQAIETIVRPISEDAGDFVKSLYMDEIPLANNPAAYRAAAKKIREQTFERNQQTTDYLDKVVEGDLSAIGGLVESTTLASTESLPYTLLALIPEVGLPLMAGAATTGKRMEYDEQGVDDMTALLASPLVGAGEYASEKISIDLLKGYFKSAPKNVRRVIAQARAKGAPKEVVQEYLKQFGKSVPAFVGDLATKEMPSEFLASINESIISNAIGAEDISWDEAINRGINESMAALPLMGAGAVVNMGKQSARAGRDLIGANSEMKRRYALVDAAIKDVSSGEAVAEFEKEGKQILKQYADNLNSLSEKELKEVVKLEKEVRVLQDENVSDGVKPFIDEKVREKQQAIDDVFIKSTEKESEAKKESDSEQSKPTTEQKEEKVNKEVDEVEIKKTPEKEKTGKSTELNIKVGDTVKATIDTYKSGKRVQSTQQAEVVSVNDDGTFNLKKGKLTYKDVKPVKIQKFTPAKSVESETKGLSPKQIADQGITELVSAIKTKSREKLDKATKVLKDKIAAKTKDLKDFKERQSVAFNMANALVDELSKSGVKNIPTSKIKGFTNAIRNAKTEKSLGAAVNKLIDTANKITVTKEEVEYKAKTKKLKKQAIKNAKKKAGQLSEEINVIASLDEVPSDFKDLYDEVMSEIGQRSAVLELKDPQKITDLYSKIQKHYEVVDDYINDLDTSDLEEVKETEEDVDISEAKEEIKNITDIKFLNPDKANSTRKFIRMSDEFLESLPKNTLKNIVKEARNLQNGFMSNAFTENLIISENAFNKANNIKKEKSLLTFGGDFKNSAEKAKKLIDGKGRKIQLNHIDDLFGSIKNTAIYENVVNPISSAFSLASSQTNNILKELTPLIRKAINSRVGVVRRSAGFNAEAQFRLNVITDLFLIERQNQQNPDSKVTPSAEKVVNRINESAKKGSSESGYTEKDVEIINEIYNSAPKNPDGSINTQEYKSKYMTKAESNLIDFIDKTYKDNQHKVIYLSEQLRGETLEMINAYAHRNTIGEGVISSDEKLKAIKGGGKYKKADAGKERTSKDPLVRLGGVTNLVKYVKEVNQDYYTSKAVREADRTIKYLKDGASKESLAYIETLGELMDNHYKAEHAQSVTHDSEGKRFFKEMLRGVYSNMLINIVSRFLPEFLSNSVTGLVESKNTVRLLKDNKLGEVLLGIDMDAIMGEYGAAHKDRIAGTLSLDLKDVTSTTLGSGFKSSGATKSAQFNDLLANNLIKDVSQAANKFYYKAVDAMLPAAWKMEFAIEFKKITGEHFDSERFKSDADYKADIDSDIRRAIARADKHISDMYNTAATFEKRLDSKETKKVLYNLSQFFMQSFSFNENSVIRGGLRAMLGRGSMGRQEGAVKLTTALARMGVYAMGTNLIAGLVFGDDDMDDIVRDSAKRSVADIIMIGLFGRMVGYQKTLIGEALSLTADYLDDEVLTKQLGKGWASTSDGYSAFFGNDFRSAGDVFRLFGGAGSLLISGKDILDESKKTLEKYKSGNLKSGDIDKKGKAKLASFRIISALLGIPMAKDIEKTYKYGLSTRVKSKKNTENSLKPNKSSLTTITIN